MNAPNGVTVAEPKLGARVSPLMVAVIVALHIGAVYLVANLDFWPLRFDSSGSLVMVRIIPQSTTAAAARAKPTAPAQKPPAAALKPTAELSGASDTASGKP